jgi:hypothetical protein
MFDRNKDTCVRLIEIGVVYDSDFYGLASQVKEMEAAQIHQCMSSLACTRTREVVVNVHKHGQYIHHTIHHQWT